MMSFFDEKIQQQELLDANRLIQSMIKDPNFKKLGPAKELFIRGFYSKAVEKFDEIYDGLYPKLRSLLQYSPDQVVVISNTSITFGDDILLIIKNNQNLLSKPYLIYLLKKAIDISEKFMSLVSFFEQGTRTKIENLDDALCRQLIILNPADKATVTKHLLCINIDRLNLAEEIFKKKQYRTAMSFYQSSLALAAGKLGSTNRADVNFAKEIYFHYANFVHVIINDTLRDFLRNQQLWEYRDYKETALALLNSAVTVITKISAVESNADQAVEWQSLKEGLSNLQQEFNPKRKKRKKNQDRGVFTPKREAKDPAASPKIAEAKEAEAKEAKAKEAEVKEPAVTVDTTLFSPTSAPISLAESPTSELPIITRAQINAAQKRRNRHTKQKRKKRRGSLIRQKKQAETQEKSREEKSTLLVPDEKCSFVIPDLSPIALSTDIKNLLDLLASFKDFFNKSAMVYLHGGFVLWHILKKSGQLNACPFLNTPPNDIDIVTSLDSGQFESLFPFLKPNPGLSKTELIVYSFSIACPEQVFTIDVTCCSQKLTCLDSLLEIARKKDLLINQFFYDHIKQQFYDPLKGMQNLITGVLETIQPSLESFSMDPSRLFRLIKDVARMGVKVSQDVQEVMRSDLLTPILAQADLSLLSLWMQRLCHREVIMQHLICMHSLQWLGAIFPDFKDGLETPEDQRWFKTILDQKKSKEISSLTLFYCCMAISACFASKTTAKIDDVQRLLETSPLIQYYLKKQDKNDIPGLLKRLIANYVQYKQQPLPSLQHRSTLFVDPSKLLTSSAQDNPIPSSRLTQ